MACVQGIVLSFMINLAHFFGINVGVLFGVRRKCIWCPGSFPQSILRGSSISLGVSLNQIQIDLNILVKYSQELVGLLVTLVMFNRVIEANCLKCCLLI